MQDITNAQSGTLNALEGASASGTLPYAAGERPRTQLKYTGSCDLAEFHARCKEHDFWYHSYYFDNGFVQRGDYDIGHDIADYGFPLSWGHVRA